MQVSKTSAIAVRAASSFDAIRLLASFAVLVGHHFLLFGYQQPIIGAYGQLAPLGVVVFFAVSGYFVAGSWDRDPHLLRYWVRRSLRIFPALIAVVLCTVFLVGPLVTELATSVYFRDPNSWSYMQNAILVFWIQYELPGVVFETATSAVNLSLWSLPIELLMYLVLSVVGFLFPKQIGVVFPILAVAGGVAWFLSPEPDGYALTQTFGLGATFFVGATIRARDLLPRVTNRVVGAVALTLVAGAFLDPLYARPLLWTLLPVAVLGLGSHRSRFGTRVAGSGDISYGVYLWAFPVQQIVISALGDPLGFYGSMAIAGMITAGLGILSMKMVEAPALRFRQRLHDILTLPDVVAPNLNRRHGRT